MAIVKLEYHTQRRKAEKGVILEGWAVKEDQIADLGIYLLTGINSNRSHRMISLRQNRDHPMQK